MREDFTIPVQNYVEKNIDTMKLSTTEWTLLIEILKMLLL